MRERTPERYPKTIRTGRRIAAEDLPHIFDRLPGGQARGLVAGKTGLRTCFRMDFPAPAWRILTHAQRHGDNNG